MSKDQEQNNDHDNMSMYELLCKSRKLDIEFDSVMNSIYSYVSQKIDVNYYYDTSFTKESLLELDSCVREYIKQYIYEKSIKEELRLLREDELNNIYTKCIVYTYEKISELSHDYNKKIYAPSYIQDDNDNVDYILKLFHALFEQNKNRYIYSNNYIRKVVENVVYDKNDDYDEKEVRDYYLNKYKYKPDYKIDEHITSPELLPIDFSKSDTIAISAPCGFGKTKELNNIVRKSPNLKILAITFRVLLVDKHYNDWNDLNFDRYDKMDVSVKDNVTRITINIKDRKDINRIICQIDSLTNVYGKFDLLILDEFEYTLHHEISFVKKKMEVYKALREHIKKTKYVIILDALLSNTSIKFIESCGRKPYVYYYSYPKHQDKKITIIKKQKDFNKAILVMLKNGHKLAISTNSEMYARTITELINKEHSNLKVGLFTGDTVNQMRRNGEIKGDPVDTFGNYDIVVYSPVVIAGSSFEVEHFDIICGYYTSSSCTAEFACQQIFRIRNIGLKSIFICVKNCGGSSIKAYNVEDIKKYYIERFKLLKGQAFNDLRVLQEASCYIERSYTNISINEDDSYFDLFCHCAYTINESKRNYLGRLLRCLIRQGITNIGVSAFDEEDEEASIVKNQFKEVTENIKNKDMKDVEDAKYYPPSIIQNFINRDNISKEEKNSVDKYLLARDFNLLLTEESNPITVEFIKSYQKFRKSYKYINLIVPLIDLPSNNFSDEIIKILHEYYPSDDYTNLSDLRKIKLATLGLINEKDTRIIRQKIIESFNLIKKLGYYSPFDNRSIIIDLKSAWDYVIQKGLDKVFKVKIDINSKPKKPNNKKQNTLSKNKRDTNTESKKQIEWINNRLNSIWGIKVSRVNNGSNTPYRIKGLDKWDIIFGDNGNMLLPIGCEPDPYVCKSYHRRLLLTDYILQKSSKSNQISNNNDQKDTCRALNNKEASQGENMIPDQHSNYLSEFLTSESKSELGQTKTDFLDKNIKNDKEVVLGCNSVQVSNEVANKKVNLIIKRNVIPQNAHISKMIDQYNKHKGDVMSNVSNTSFNISPDKLLSERRKQDNIIFDSKFGYVANI